MPKRQINIGDMYDRLTVIADLGIKETISSKGNSCARRTYLCRCKCGNEIEITGVRIGRNVKSCGCLRRENREKPIKEGSRYGRLTVKTRVDSVKGRGHQYLCACDCGGEKIVASGDLRGNYVRSCGCLNRESLRRVSKKAYENNYVHGTSILMISTKKPSKNNTSGIRGVCWYKPNKAWCARITFKGKNYHLGYFEKLEDAAAARSEAETRLYDSFLEWYHNEKKSDN